MVYPNRDHGLREGTGTSVHVRMLIIRYLLEHLPPSGEPKIGPEFTFGITMEKFVDGPSRPEWTEVYDLKNDPYELRNLPADGPLATQLNAELEKQMTVVNFKPLST